MAFRFRLDDPIQKNFRRIGLEQIQRARQQLVAKVAPATEVHEARKCIKRVRALLRLGRAGLGERVFRAENASFRSIAAMLAGARDDHVLLETVVKLESESGDDTRPALARLKAAIVGERAETAKHDAADIANAADGLEKAARRFRRLSIEPDDFSTLATGLTRSYRRGIEWLEVAYADNGDEAFHEWRKCVQAHWRHMALLSRAWPALIEARIQAARELSQILGDDHDLSILKAKLFALPAGAVPRTEIGNIERLIDTCQVNLRRAAKPRGQMLFAETAKAHGRWISAVWDGAAARNRVEKEPAERPAAAPLDLPQMASLRA